MAQPEPRPWGRAALGGLLVALGGAVFGATRKAKPSAAKPAAAKPSTAKPSAAKPAAKSPGKAGKSRRGRDRAGPPAASGAAGAPPRAGTGQSRVRTKPKPPRSPARTRYWPPPVPKPIEDAPEEHGPRHGVPPADPDAVKRGYEGFDAKPGTIVKVMLTSAGVIAGSIAVLFYLIGLLHREDARSVPLTPQQAAVIVPPGPRLQDHPLHDIAMERKRESDLLKYYAWTDAGHRAGRIPISRAQALVIGRPLDPPPAPPAATPPATPALPATPARPATQP